MVTALQEVGVSMLRQKAGNVAWDLNIEAVQDRQDQLRPVEGEHAQQTHFIQLHRSNVELDALFPTIRCRLTALKATKAERLIGG